MHTHVRVRMHARTHTYEETLLWIPPGRTPDASSQSSELFHLHL